MKARILALLLLVGFCAVGHADVRWLQTDYDFGTWREVQGRRTGVVRFVNEGTDTVAVISVRPGCGCTSADWYKDPVAPGDTAWVSFTYDPTHRPGRFEKTVKVYTDPGRQLQVIKISGTVVGTPETLARDYPVQMGDLRLSGLNYDFGVVRQGEMRHGYLVGYNQGADTIRPVVSLSKGALDGRIAGHGVAPGEPFTIGFFLTTRELSVGAHQWPVKIICGGQSLNATVSADIEAVRPMLDSAAMADAPRIDVPSAPVEAAQSRAGKAKFAFSIGNIGRSAMRVQRVYSRAGAVHINKAPRTVKAGKSARIEGYVDLTDITAPAYSFIIEVITDDPLQPVAKIRISGSAASTLSQ